MHRFFVAPDCIQKGELRLGGGQAHQITDVLHLKPGEIIAALDGRGNEYRVELTRVAHHEVEGRVLDAVNSSSEPRTHLVLYQSLLKADKFEWVLQKGTEIGVAEFRPISTSRAIAASVSSGKLERWQRIIAEAAEQSGRCKIPPLHPLQTYEAALEQAQALGGLGVIPWEQEGDVSLRRLISAYDRGGPISVFVGPEGGFAAAEIDAATAHGIHSVTLGPRILRAETAGLVAASLILYERGDMDAENQHG